MTLPDENVRLLREARLNVQLIQHCGGMMQKAAKIDGVLIVIPSRNRATLAGNAILSILDQPDNDAKILVSDNSTIAEEADELGKFCDGLKDARVRYVRPPAPLPMPDHWEWALRQALSSYGASHIAYLTDRMVFKTNELGPLVRLAAQYPDKLICYNHDRINDLRTPIRLEQVSWSGGLFKLDSFEFLASSARFKWQFFACLPRMLNCVAPRSVFATIADRYGNVFLSTAPDCCFAYRYLERFDSLLYYDRAPLMHYALDRSNGAGTGRGVVSGDFADFLANLNGKPLCYAAPLPEFPTVMNTVIHEYYLVKEQTRSPKFIDVDRQGYLDCLAGDIRRMQDSGRKSELQALLDKHRRRITVSLHAGEEQHNGGNFTQASQPASQKRGFLSVFLENGFGAGSTNRKDKNTEFDTVADAIAYGRAHARRRNWGRSTVESNMPSRQLWGAASPAGWARALFLYGSRPVVLSWITLHSWFNRYVRWRFRERTRSL